jgi:hypothetical protein
MLVAPFDLNATQVFSSPTPHVPRYSVYAQAPPQESEEGFHIVLHAKKSAALSSTAAEVIPRRIGQNAALEEFLIL